MTAAKARCWTVWLFWMLAASWGDADITYTFHLEGVDAGIADTIRASVTEAVGLYNQHGSFNKHLHIYYNAGVPTAQANYDGVITFGGSRNTRVALHEMAHTLGIGTIGQWSANLSGGVWQGWYADRLARLQGADVLHGDSMHFWPWGLNYDSEDGFMERIYHVRTVAALRCDMGILAYARQPKHQTALLGGTAVFSAAAPAAASWRWYKDGTALTDGGDISGAAGPQLRIANADFADEGRYWCAAAGAGETLLSRPARLTIKKLAAYYRFEGNANDSAASNHAVAYGSPSYAAGKTGQAIDLDGTDDWLVLPAGIADTDDLTVGAWVYWDGGGNWQRIFDFGTGTSQYLFLTPSSGSNTLRFAVKNGGSEQIVETARLAVGQWVHLAVVLRDMAAVLYVNGRAAADSGTVTIDPRDFAPAVNYIGDSQFAADPLFNGRIDDFRIYNFALHGSDIWNWWGQSTDSAPQFAADPLVLPDGVQGTAYAGQTLTAWAGDADGDALTFCKVSGPAWLSVGSGGQLSGTPGSADAGENAFIVRAADPSGACTDTQVIIYVHGRAAAHYPFEGNALDQSGSGWNGTASGWPAYVSGFSGQALDLDGTDDYVTLPAGIIRTADFTIAAWVNWDGGASWQRIFDFGNNTTRYMFLTPSSPSGTLRFAVTAAGNGWEERVETAALTPGVWTHVAVSRSGGTIALYVNGTQRAVNPASTISPADFAPAYNYIGKSQWPDPLFSGRIDDFRIYNYALSSSEIAALGSPSFFIDEQFANDDAAELAPYAGRPLTEFITDAGGSGPLVFSKVSGPSWLTVLPDGTLSGIPSDRNVGANVFTVRITDAAGLWDTARMTIAVADTYSGTQGLADLLGLSAWWLSAGCSDLPPCGGADLSGDGQVGAADAAVLARFWLADESLQVHLPLDGPVLYADRSVYGRSAEGVNGPQAAGGVLGGAVYLDGIDDYIRIPGYKGISGSGSRTCAAWIKTAKPSSQIVSWGSLQTGGKWTIRVNEDGTLRAEVQGGYVYGTTAIADGLWHHIAVVLSDDGSADISEAVLYVDGRAEPGSGGVMGCGVNTESVGDVKVGVNIQGTVYFEGLIDDLRIYDAPLSAQEIQNLAVW